MKKNVFFSLLALLGLLGAAGPAGGQPVAAAPAYHDPSQYGKPFAEVPESQNATIYQVNLRGFSQAGNFRGVRARLDSIKALGVNVLYLMPIYPIGKVRAVDSPFAVQDYTAVNPEFGTLADLRALVDGAHSRGMSVMLDWVANHTSWDHAWATAHSDWYLRDAAGNLLPPPTPPTPTWRSWTSPIR